MAEEPTMEVALTHEQFRTIIELVRKANRQGQPKWDHLLDILEPYGWNDTWGKPE